MFAKKMTYVMMMVCHSLFHLPNANGSSVQHADFLHLFIKRHAVDSTENKEQPTRPVQKQFSLK